MLNHLITAAVLAALCAAANAGPMTLLEEAAEFERLDARVSDDHSGYVRVAACDQCEPLRLEIHAATMLEVDGQPQSLKTLNRRALHDGTIFYDPQSKRIMRIVADR